ncbi:3-isopropylmalate dehydrogenase [Actinomadura barringtoniae]|uniref:3-isopropylmalate dehydrogenase n=1 Tax=Actinomadura barringtoniae TaxID=1427535 RepID=A0A939TCT4_9ACTN|nr:3-isopropylmalate dehydrogenase [Actinomadura barringtoniae]MBO2454897.1 3-isopropylmalate dehydrogenase [Actinomadura barringtoniae]
MVSRNVRLAVIAGDGIGPEVVAEGLKVLEAIAPASGLSFEQTPYDLGAARWHRTGEVLPDSVLDELRGHEAILLGAIGDPTVPSGTLERGLLLRMRFELDQYVNLRPVKLLPGASTPLANVQPEDIDMIVVREGTEGPYAGVGGVLRKGTPHEVATQESVNTALGVERIIRYAFEQAAARPRKKLTLVHKDNVLTFAAGLYQRYLKELSAEFPQVEVDYSHVDAATMFFVNQPRRYDVIVTDNLFGDIITDLGAAVAGGIGLAASGNINPTGAAPSMFEPVHGSAPDIAGQGKADPTATILSVVMLLDHLGAAEAARRVEQAVADDLLERPGLGARSTAQIGDAIAKRVSG